MSARSFLHIKIKKTKMKEVFQLKGSKGAFMKNHYAVHVFFHPADLRNTHEKNGKRAMSECVQTSTNGNN
jgi:hypothetical protein